MKFHKINQSFFELAFGGGTPRKAFLTACVVGTILITINHGDQILVGNYPHPLKIALTYCVPYCVTTWGAITGKLHGIITGVQEFFNDKKIMELSFFNFENAITAAYFADENLKVVRVNNNFKKFFERICKKPARIISLGSNFFVSSISFFSNSIFVSKFFLLIVIFPVPLDTQTFAIDSFLRPVL